MNNSQIRYEIFLKVAELGNITMAAEALSYSGLCFHISNQVSRLSWILPKEKKEIMNDNICS